MRAERAGLSVRGLSDLERGVRHSPHPATVGRLAHALGLEETARAALGRTRAAAAELREAVRIARSLGDPALFLGAASALLALDGNDALAAEASTTACRMLVSLPTEAMRERFLAAEPVRRLGGRLALSSR